MNAKRAHIELELGSVDGGAALLECDPQCTASDLFRVPGALVPLDHWVAVRVVIEVAVSLGQDADAKLFGDGRRLRAADDNDEVGIEVADRGQEGTSDRR